MKKPILLTAMLSATLLAGAPFVSAQSTPATDTGGDEQELVHDWYLNVTTVSMFTDTLRADFIATGTIVSVDNEGLPVLTFQPDEYLSGTPLAQAQVDLHTGTNADLRDLEGKRVVAGVVYRPDQDKYGLAHGVQSLTPEGFGVETSTQFYRDVLAKIAPWQQQVDAALEANPEDGKFAFPQELVSELVDTFVEYMGQTGTQAAHHAARELTENVIFEGRLSEDHFASMASNLLESDPGTYDRGYSYLLMAKYENAALSLENALGLILDETAFINLDHLVRYAKVAWTSEEDLAALVEGLGEIMIDTASYTDEQRHNVMQVISRHGDKGFLPYMHQRLGHESTISNKRVLLECFRNIPDASNLKPLISYLSGGSGLDDAYDAENFVKIHEDCATSRGFFKRTMVAIARINTDIDAEKYNAKYDSAEEQDAAREQAVHASSNAFLRSAYAQARYPWVKDFLKLLQPENEGWRTVIQILPFEDTLPIEPRQDEADQVEADTPEGEAAEGGNGGSGLGEGAGNTPGTSNPTGEGSGQSPEDE